jgi:threonine dehydrogenase-like Zn-dependent dehydrogenase
MMQRHPQRHPQGSSLLMIGLIAIGLMFVSCAPVAAAFNIFASDQLKAKLRLARDGTGATVTFSAGEQEAQEVALYIGGEGLKLESPTDGSCKPVQDGLGCIIKSSTASGEFVVKLKGKQHSANVTYYRPGSDKPYFLLAEAR